MNVNGIGTTGYPAWHSAKRTRQNTAEQSFRAQGNGDMVVPQPPNYLGFTYDGSISNKSKAEMTMDEYKQWFMKEMSGMPVSGWYRSTCVGGALTITEECFERMKTDPEWEKTVLGMVRDMYSCTGIMGSQMIGYQVIGATPGQCYGQGIPVRDHSSLSADNAESWWEKRHKRMKKLMKEQEKEAVKKARAQKAAAHKNYQIRQMASRHRQQAFFAASKRNGQNGVNQAVIQSIGVSALAVTAYEENISAFSKRILESQLI